MSRAHPKPTAPQGHHLSTNFILPSKNRTAIPIRSPNEINSLQHYSTASSAEVTSKKGNEIATIQTKSPNLNDVRSKKYQTTPAKPPQQISYPTQEVRGGTALQKTQNSHTTSIPSSLDVSSPNYIPLWLRAVNESYAHLRPCPPFPTTDFTAYLTTIVGPEFVREVSLVSLPPPVQTQIIETDLVPSSYGPYWQKLLQNEFASRNVQYISFALYNQTIQAVPKKPGLFALHIPGLKEHAPRVDLGDVVHVRVLHSPVPIHEHQVAQWYKFGQASGAICPGFTGILYDPRVWEINRTQETVMLRMDGISESMRCNISFLLQESKLEPIYRAVQNAACDNLWLDKMLFPSPEDGVLQTTLSPAIFNVSWVDELNWEQKKAVHSVLSNNYGVLPYLISGPPGTGKTKTLVETAMQLSHKDGHILICAPSDTAADTLALRLSLHLKPFELFRLNGPTRTFAEVPDRLLLYTHSNDLSFSLPPIEHLLSFRVVVTTCRDADLLNRGRVTNTCLYNLFNGVKRFLSPGSAQQPLHWTALLLDEAAQATEPEVLIPLTVVMSPNHADTPQFVLAGDQFQLGPALLSSSKLNVSLFQRLFDRDVYRNHPLSRQNGSRAITAKMLPIIRPAFTNLIRNYRSHAAILSVPSSMFYNDTLIPERRSSEEILTWPGWCSSEQWPVLFCQTKSDDFYESITDGDGTGAGALYNPGEASIALATVSSLLEHAGSSTHNTLEQREVMVMSPFRAQVAYLRKLFRQHHLYEVNIGPLEAFQGLESRVVIICTTRTRLGNESQPKDHHVRIDNSRGLGVINEPKRLNVAITRAQEGLIVIGNATCLSSTGDPAWLAFLDFCRRNHCYQAPAGFVWPDLGGPHLQGRLERALIYATLGKVDARQAEDGVPNQSRTVAGGFRLRGPHREMDEEMWQLKELAQLRDSEQVDLVVGDATGIGLHDMEEVNISEAVDDYDRNLKQEFHRECVTQ